MEEAQQLYLAANPQHEILEIEDGKLLVALETTKRIEYELVPALCDEGVTIQDLEEHMRQEGHNVQGISDDGRYVIVLQTVKGKV